MLPVLFAAGAAIAAVFISGCSRNETKTPVQPPRKEPEPKSEFERVSKTLVHYKPDCFSKTNCFEKNILHRQLIIKWFDLLSKGSVPHQSEVFRRGIQQVRQLSKSDYGMYQFMGKTARFIQLLEAHRMEKKDVNTQQLQNAFFEINLNLVWNRGHPLALLGNYLKGRAALMAEGQGKEFVQLIATFLPWLDWVQICAGPPKMMTQNKAETCNEKDLRGHAIKFRNQLFADGKFSDLEKELTGKLAKEWIGHISAEGNVVGYLTLFRYVSSIDGDPLQGPFLTIQDAKGQSHKFLVNMGLPVTDQEEKDIRQNLLKSFSPGEPSFWKEYIKESEKRGGHQEVPDISKTVIRDNVLWESCYEAALCKASEYNRCKKIVDWSPSKKLNSDYRMVSLGKERVQKGDLLVYLNPELENPDIYVGSSTYLSTLSLKNDRGKKINLRVTHISTVTKVNSSGIPTRAIGVMGVHAPVQEHDARRVTISYGPLIAVFREK